MPALTPTERSQRNRKALKTRGGVIVQATLRPDDPDEAAKQWDFLVYEKGGPKAAMLYLLRLSRGIAVMSDRELLTELAARLGRAARDETPAPPRRKKAGG